MQRSGARGLRGGQVFLLHGEGEVDDEQGLPAAPEAAGGRSGGELEGDGQREGDLISRDERGRRDEEDAHLQLRPPQGGQV